MTDYVAPVERAEYYSLQKFFRFIPGFRRDKWFIDTCSYSSQSKVPLRTIVWLELVSELEFTVSTGHVWSINSFGSSTVLTIWGIVNDKLIRIACPQYIAKKPIIAKTHFCDIRAPMGCLNYFDKLYVEVIKAEKEKE